MAKLKKNAINQIMFTMVDKTDFATIEASLASDFTVKKFGVTALGTVASAVVTTVASAVKKVGSGVYKIALTASQCNYDQLFLRIAHASAATQMLQYELATMNDADTSNYLSQLANPANVSGICANVWKREYFGSYETSLASSYGSAFQTLYDFNVSTLSTRISKSLVSASAFASVASAMSTISKIYSCVQPSQLGSVIWQTKYNVYQNVSAMNSTMAYYLTGNSLHSDIASAVWAHAKGSLVYGALTVGESRYSDFISDIGSAVWAQHWTKNSAVSSFGSAFEVWVSSISDIKSGVSVLQVRVPSTVATSSGIDSKFVAHSTSLASAVWAHNKGASALSLLSQLRVRANYSTVSDMASKIVSHTWASAKGASVLSLLSQLRVRADYSTVSDMASKIWAATKGASALSLLSQIRVRMAYSTADAFASDIASHVWGAAIADHSLTGGFGSKIFSAIQVGPAAADATSIAKAVWRMDYSLYGSGVSQYGSMIRTFKTTLLTNLSGATHIASHVWTAAYTGAQFSTALTVGSMVRRLASNADDAYSAINAAATASAVAAAVWNEPPAGHSGATTPLSMLKSAIAAGPGATVGASDVDSIVSAVWARKYTIAHGASSFGSGFRVMLSNTSLIPGMSNILSAVYVDTADISDVLSKVHVHADGISDIVSNIKVQTDKLSGISNILSNVFVDTADISNIVSGIKVQTDKVAGMSDILSKVYVHTAGISDKVSDINSFLQSTISGVDLYSKVVKLASRVPAMTATNSKLGVVEGYASAAKVGASVLQVRVVSTVPTVSGVSDIVSNLISAAFANATYLNKVGSAVWAQHWTVHSAASSFGSAFERVLSNTSDIGSKVWAADKSDNAAASSFGSMLWTAIAGGPAATITSADISNIASAVWSESISALKGVAASFGSRFAKLPTSDALSKAQSSIEHHVSDVTATITNANMSTIASLVWARAWDTNSLAGSFGSAFEVLMSNASDAKSAASQANSRALKIQTMVSDINSQVWSVGTISSLKTAAGSFGSRFAKLTTSGALVTAEAKIESHVSGITAVVDETGIVSQVWAHATAASLVSRVSDIQSALDSQYAHMLSQTLPSNIASGVWAHVKGVSTLSTLSDLQRGLDSQYTKVYSLVGVAKVQASAAHAGTDSQYTKLYSQTAPSNIASGVWTHVKGTSVLSTLSDLQRGLDSQYTHVYSAVQAGGLNSAALVNIADAVWDEKWHDHSLVSTVGSRFEVLTSSVSNIESCITDSFLDGTALTANSLRDRLRTTGWVLRNRLVVTDASGNAVLYKDDGTTPAFSVGAQFTDTGVITTRKRYE